MLSHVIPGTRAKPEGSKKQNSLAKPSRREAAPDRCPSLLLTHDPAAIREDALPAKSPNENASPKETQVTPTSTFARGKRGTSRPRSSSKNAVPAAFKIVQRGFAIKGPGIVECAFEMENKSGGLCKIDSSAVSPEEESPLLAGERKLKNAGSEIKGL
ncbi:hypothetical protein KM043_011126 [Ampulex compressa]|nr:hypothetical protein KM043_011126 [Ampulex compressa]